MLSLGSQDLSVCVHSYVYVLPLNVWLISWELGFYIASVIPYNYF
jgi:hypothetical protein